jgi:hypothetical protein
MKRDDTVSFFETDKCNENNNLNFCGSPSDHVR